MKVKKITGGSLIYDRYYSTKPIAADLILKKLLICCGMSVCPMMYLLTEYEFGVSLPFMAAVSALFSAGFLLLFVFVKKRFAVPCLLVLAGFFVSDELVEKLTYFVDAAMLLVDGRFLHPRGYLLHEAELLSVFNADYVEGVMIGCVILCAIYAFVCALSVTRKPRVLPPLILFAALCSPCIISETLEFNLWLIPTIAIFAAVAAISSCYSSGIAAKNTSSGMYRKYYADNERRFRQSVKRQNYGKRIAMTASHYSKYFSVGIWCAALCAAALGIGAAAFEKGESLDYTDIYDFIMNIGNDARITASPFEDGPVSEYFTSPKKENSTALNVTSPGTGEQDIIRVTYSGSGTIYLRGDIGIDFDGSSWTTNVNAENELWSALGLKEDYRPCEMRVVHSLLEAKELPSQNYVAVSDVTIDYLCETSVVFLPAYTAEFSYFDNPRFNVYGDVVVRVNEDFGSVNTVQCTSLTPVYSLPDTGADGAAAIKYISELFTDSHCDMDSIYSTVIPEMSETSNIFSKYESYVNSTYSDVPAELSASLEQFLSDSGLDKLIDKKIAEYSSATSADSTAYYDAVAAYATGEAVTEFLQENYVYSLTAENDSENPVMSFLTETKSGHCSLYASAMTLIMRELGFPARYCTGFVVNPAGTEGHVTLRARNLHAWCEVYLGELGWVTFDPTGSAANTGNNAAPVRDKPETAESASESAEERPETPVKPQQTTSQSQTSSDSAVSDNTEETAQIEADDGIDLELLVKCLIAVAAALIVVIIAVIVVYKYKALGNDARDGLECLSESSSDEIYHVMLTIAEMFGFAPRKGELPAAFYGRLDGCFGTSLAENCRIIEAVAFGNGAISDEANEAREILSNELRIMTASAEKRADILLRVKVRRLLAKYK
jgi:transglutaminase-like putative cysteine protease